MRGHTGVPLMFYYRPTVQCAYHLPIVALSGSTFVAEQYILRRGGPGISTCRNDEELPR